MKDACKGLSVGDNIFHKSREHLSGPPDCWLLTSDSFSRWLIEPMVVGKHGAGFIVGGVGFFDNSLVARSDGASPDRADSHNCRCIISGLLDSFHNLR